MTIRTRATGTEASPAPRTYWVVEGKFLAGAYPGAPDPHNHRARIVALWNAGVRTFINLMESDETNNAGKPFASYEDIVNELAEAAGVTAWCVRFSIRDLGVPSHYTMDAIISEIEHALLREGVTYVHCFGGVGRTGITVCSWLLAHGLTSPETVFADLTELRRADKIAGQRPAPETNVQRDFVTQFAKSIRATPARSPARARSSIRSPGA